MAELLIANELAMYLIDEGVAVDFNTPSNTVPSILVDPLDGAPMPRTEEGETATVTVIDSMLSGPTGAGAEAYLEEAFLDVIVRATTAGACKLIHRQIRGLVHPIADHRGRQMWTMHDLLVSLSTIWRAEQPLDIGSEQLASTGPRAEREVWSRIASYRFEVRRKALAGQPLAP